MFSFLKLLKRELKVKEVYLFGSRVYGTPLKDSDLDMLIISEEFEKYSFIERMLLLSKLWDSPFTLEMFPYTPKEVEIYKGRKVVVTEALERGIRIGLE